MRQSYNDDSVCCNFDLLISLSCIWMIKKHGLGLVIVWVHTGGVSYGRSSSTHVSPPLLGVDSQLRKRWICRVLSQRWESKTSSVRPKLISDTWVSDSCQSCAALSPEVHLCAYVCVWPNVGCWLWTSAAWITSLSAVWTWVRLTLLVLWSPSRDAQIILLKACALLP